MSTSAKRQTLRESLLLRELRSHEIAILEEVFTELRYDRGDVVIAEDEESDALYIVLEGEARAVRGPTTLFRVLPGEFFGEIGLLTNEPRAASVIAETALTVARLDQSTIDRLTDSHPHLTVRLIRRVALRFRQLLSEMTDSVMLLLSDRGRRQRTELTVRINGDELHIKAATPVGSLLPPTVGDARVIAALVDRKTVSLSVPLFASAQIAPITPADWEGRRVYRRSVGLLLAEAAHQVDPRIQVRIGPSLGFAHLVEVGERAERTPVALVSELVDAMRRLVDRAEPVRRERWAVEEAKAQFLDQGWEDAALLLATWRSPTLPLASCGQVYAIEVGPFVPSMDYLDAFDLVVENDDLLLYFGDTERRSSGLVRASHPGRLAREHEQWLGALGATSVGAYNELVVHGRVSEIIQVSEGFHEKRVGQIADEIHDRELPVRVICVAGPSSAGKTTFIKRLNVQLAVNGLKPHSVSLDDYYVDREKTIRDEQGEYDFEAFEALSYDLMADHLGRLMAGESVRTARYDFKTGRSHPEGGPVLRLGEGDVLLLEGIHALNPNLPVDDGGGLFRVFINPMTSIPVDHVNRINVSDVRLLRRIVRDRRRRGIDAARNIQRWPSVRRGERRHIFPYQERANAVFNTSLIYETSVLKVYAERYLLEVPEDHPSYTTAFRLRRLIDRFVTIYPDHVPPTSLIREFIGGSSFDR